MKAVVVFLLILVSNLFSTQLLAESPLAEPNWTRSAAMHAVDKSETVESLKPLYEMARSGNDSDLMVALRDISRNPSLSAPQRDYLVFRFTVGLSDLEVNAVNPEVISYLSGYQAETLVAHDDHPGKAVPMFNVRAAAHGVSNQWQRQQAAIDAERISRESPDQFVSAFLASSPAQQRGFVDALEFVSREHAAELSKSAQSLLNSNPQLTLLATQAALKSGDTKLLHQAIALGDGPGLSKAFAAVSPELDADEAVALLKQVMEQESASKASLAIAHLAPSRLDSPQARELLFVTLSDPDLGASAALVLGSSPDPEIRLRLNSIAAAGDDLQNQRAALALRIEPVTRGDVL